MACDGIVILNEAELSGGGTVRESVEIDYTTGRNFLAEERQQEDADSLGQEGI